MRYSQPLLGYWGKGKIMSRFSPYDPEHVGTFYSTVYNGYVFIMEIKKTSYKRDQKEGVRRYANFIPGEKKSDSCYLVRRNSWIEYLGNVVLPILSTFGGGDYVEHHEVSLIHIPVFYAGKNTWGEKLFCRGRKVLNNYDGKPPLEMLRIDPRKVIRSTNLV